MSTVEMEADGDCACGRPGTLVVDPIQDALYGFQIPVVLCPDCYTEGLNAV